MRLASVTCFATGRETGTLDPRKECIVSRLEAANKKEVDSSHSVLSPTQYSVSALHWSSHPLFCPSFLLFFPLLFYFYLFIWWTFSNSVGYGFGHCLSPCSRSCSQLCSCTSYLCVYGLINPEWLHLSDHCPYCPLVCTLLSTILSFSTKY